VLTPYMLLFTFPQKSRHTESEKLQVQIQAYLDNVFDVGGLLEDAETKNVALEKVEELEEHVSHVSVLCLPEPLWKAGHSWALEMQELTYLPPVEPQGTLRPTEPL
jgi:hypothetical protein